MLDLVIAGEDEVLVLELAQPAHPVAEIGAAARAVELLALDQQRFVHQAAAHAAVIADADLDLALLDRVEHLAPGRDADLDMDCGVAPVEAGDGLVELGRHEARDDLDADDALDPLGRLRDLVRHHPRRFEHVLAQRHHRLARGRHLDPGGVAVEQGRPDMILEPLERGADARLLAVELARGRADAAGADDVDEGAHQVPVDPAGELLVDQWTAIGHLAWCSLLACCGAAARSAKS